MRSAHRHLGSHVFCLLALGILGLAFTLGSPSAVNAEETINLSPEDRADWTPGNLFGWLRPGHNYEDRYIRVKTVPEGALVDLFYIRSNFQKRYEQAEAPVRVNLPQRIHAGPRDAVMIRAFLEGYRQKEVNVRVSSDVQDLLLELEPLPNELVAASHVYLAGRSSLSFLTKEALTVRVQNRSDGFNVVLAETSRGTEAGDTLDQVRSPLLKKVEALQLGEDLLVQVRSHKDGGKFDLRSRQSQDPLRDLFVYTVDLVPADGGVNAVQNARAALANLGPGAVSGCAARFDTVLRSTIDPSSLSRALAPKGAFTDPYLRAAMKRLGEVSPGGVIAMMDGSKFNPASSIELAAAMSQPGEAKGYLALLRAFVNRVESGEHRDQTLHGIVAPELASSKFKAALDQASAAERSCRGA